MRQNKWFPSPELRRYRPLFPAYEKSVRLSAMSCWIVTRFPHTPIDLTDGDPDVCFQLSASFHQPQFKRQTHVRGRRS